MDNFTSNSKDIALFVFHLPDSAGLGNCGKSVGQRARSAYPAANTANVPALCASAPSGTCPRRSPAEGKARESFTYYTLRVGLSVTV